MFKTILARYRQGYRTMEFPGNTPSLPERYVGRPVIESSRCSHCSACEDACPTGAISLSDKKLKVDLGLCIFCSECSSACSVKCISHAQDFRMAVRLRENLVAGKESLTLAEKLEEKRLKIFKRSLKLRQVSAGGCNACESDTNVLGTIGWDLGRFGIQFVASPRHADGILVTGPITQNMKTALIKTYEAVPSPKVVIAVGACALSGGPFTGHTQVHGGLDSLLPVDLFIPGCPPHPLTILDGLLRFLGNPVFDKGILNVAEQR